MKTRIFTTMLVLLAIATTAQAQTCTITVSAYPEEGGSVSGGGTYAYGETVTLTATPKEGHNFLYWRDGKSIVSKNSTYSFTARDRELTAWFGGGPYNIVRVTAEGGGDVKVVDSRDSGNQGEEIIIEGGRSVIAKAIPHNDYFFAGWVEADKWVSVNKWSSLDVNNELEFFSTKPEFGFIVGKDTHLKAVFLPKQCNLSVILDLYSRESPKHMAVCVYDEWLNWGDAHILKIDPPEGYGFVEWGSNNIIETATSAAIIVNDFGVIFSVKPYAQKALLTFKFQTYDLNINASASSAEGGTVSGGGSFDYGEEVTLTATPNEDYQFVCWTEEQLLLGSPQTSPDINGPIEVSTEASYTFTVSRSRNLTAVFVEKPYPLWIGDTQVNPGNKDNILNAIDPATNEPTAAYNPVTKTLTLRNPEISGAHADYKIYSEDSLTIEGEATITGDKGIAVVSEAAELNTLTIQNAALDISAQWEAIYARNTHVCMNSGTVSAASAQHRAVNVQVHGSFTMNGGELVIDSDKEGLMVWRGNQQAYVDGENNIVINGGRIDATAAGGAPVWASGVITLPANYYAHLYGGDTPLSLEHVELNDNYSCFVDESGERITGDRIVIEPNANYTVTLLDDDSNDNYKNYQRIQANLGEQMGEVKVRIEGRTLYRNGHWNTLMLPFSLDNFEGTPLEGADVRELVPDECAYSNGTLTLKFASVSAIEANKPYIVRWAASDENIVDPVFANVYLEDGIQVIDLFEGGILFFGTYDSFAVPEFDRKHYLYMGGDSKLYYPNGALTIHSFRTYFYLRDFVAGEPTSTGSAKGIGEFVLNFGDETTKLESTPDPSRREESDDYYSLDGRKLSGEPTKKGVYIVNGKKMVK